MSCKSYLSLSDIEQQQQEIPFIDFNDQMMSIVSHQIQITPETNFDILLNKHLNNLQITDVQLQQLPENERNVLCQIQNKGKDKRKRNDQCQKLFYKRAFKYSQDKFFKRCKNRSRKMSRFYHFHFDYVSKTEDIPLTQFYHPNKKTKPGMIIGYKTFNSKYVKLLLKSKTFRDDIKQYHDVFIEDCIKQRKIKLISFEKSVRKIMVQSNQKQKQLQKFLKSSQFKIPWTLRQLQQAWELAQRDLQQLMPKVVQQDLSLKVSLGIQG